MTKSLAHSGRRCGTPRSLLSLVLAAAPLLLLACGLLARASEPAPEPDVALERTRAQAKMLDDLMKVAVVDITNRYDGPPAAKVAKSIFSAAKEKQYFDARLVDITGAPLNEANIPKDKFEERAAEAISAGKDYFEEVVGKGDERRLRVATAVPAVVKKCATCHGVKEGDPLGFLSYDLPVK